MQGASFTAIGTVDHVSETKEFNDGTPFGVFCLKITRKLKDSEREDFVYCNARGDDVAYVSQLKEGELVYVAGTINSRKYQDKHIMNLWVRQVYKLVGGGEKPQTAKKAEIPSQVADPEEGLPF